MGCGTRVYRDDPQLISRTFRSALRTERCCSPFGSEELFSRGWGGFALVLRSELKIGGGSPLRSGVSLGGCSFALTARQQIGQFFRRAGSPSRSLDRVIRIFLLASSGPALDAATLDEAAQEDCLAAHAALEEIADSGAVSPEDPDGRPIHSQPRQGGCVMKYHSLLFESSSRLVLFSSSECRSYALGRARNV